MKPKIINIDPKSTGQNSDQIYCYTTTCSYKARKTKQIENINMESAVNYIDVKPLLDSNFMNRLANDCTIQPRIAKKIGTTILVLVSGFK